MADPFRVNCGSLNGLLYPDRYGPAGKSLCIKVENEDRWITPIDFERLAGKGSQHNWKRTLKSLSHDNKQLLQIIEEGVMSTCSDKSCNCSACEISRGIINTPKRSATSETALATSSFKVEKTNRDTDSDSGISVEISSSSPSSSSTGVPFTTKDQEQVPTEYTPLVQEAILSLTSGKSEADKTKDGGNSGCSMLGIILYIIHHYHPDESIAVVNTKIRAALALLQRMGIVDRSGDNDEDDDIIPVMMDAVSEESKQEQEPAKLSSDKKVEVKSKQQVKAESTPGKVSSKPKSDGKPKPTNSANINNSVSIKQKKAKAATKKAKAVLASKTTKKAMKLKLKEKGGNVKVAKRGRPPKASTGKENSEKANFPFHLVKQKKLSPQLAAVCGRPLMSRHEAVRNIWLYIKKAKLQDGNQRTVIHCDEKLKAVTKKKKVTCSEILQCLGAHMKDAV